MEFKNESELIEWVYDMHLQNLSGREDFTEAFKNGIESAIEELKLLNLPDVIDMVCRNSNCCNNDHIKKICLDQEHSKICGSRKT